MKSLLLVVAVVCLSGWAAGQPVPDTAGFQIADVESYTLAQSSGNSAKYRLKVTIPESNGTVVDAYETEPYLIRLQGSRSEMGKDYAVLVGDEVIDCYNYVLKHAGVTAPQKITLQLFLDNQWNSYLSKQVPQDYLDELQGMKTENHKVYDVVTRVIVIANLPSDLPQDMIPILNDERQNGNGEDKQAWKEIQESEGFASLQDSLTRFKAAQCSMMAVWGSRTQDGQLFSGRNLDYVRDLGVNSWKSVIVWVPDAGGSFENPIAHAAFGYLALYGAMSGMNQAGLTVHEANLEEKNETFSGFPWILRLRYIMEGSKNLKEGVKLWKETNNTVGYNHMIAHQPLQNEAGMINPSPSPAAWVMETAAHYTAYFQDNDPREQTSIVNGENTGFPLNEALWRTNHPYDAALMTDYLWWNTSAYQSSQERYEIAHDTIVAYQESAVPIDYIQAINWTANVAAKGMASPYLCVFPYASEEGTNILSVTHQPQQLVSFVAWDNGEGDAWSPACCNTYVRIHLGQFF